jgi:hypothetical protein
MVSIVPHLTTNCRARQLRISVPLIECLVDDVRYFRPDTLPAVGEGIARAVSATADTRRQAARRARNVRNADK